jgi:cytochrome bd-type quinol oxidase subunit 2
LFSSRRRARRLQRYALRAVAVCAALAIVWFAARKHAEETLRSTTPMLASASWAARLSNLPASPRLFSLSSLPGSLPALSLTLTRSGRTQMFPRISPGFFRNTFGPANFTPIAFQFDSSARLAPKFFFVR